MAVRKAAMMAAMRVAGRVEMMVADSANLLAGMMAASKAEKTVIRMVE